MNEELTTYQLATINIPDIKGIKELTFDEFTKYNNYISTLNMLSHDESFFNLVILNHVDMKSRIKEYIKEYENNSSILVAEQNTVYLNINRLILNFLSSVRAFLDHTETRIKRNSGENSEEALVFKVLTNKAFDDSFSYRFLSKLRNYSQHCGLPASEINILSTGDEKGATVNTLSLLLVRDTLLKNFDSWGTRVKEELKAQIEYFDIMPLIDEMFEKLKVIHREITSKMYLKFHIEGYALMELL